MEKKFMELLAPAGSKEAFIAAVESGADAVYLAGPSFGARAYADNFDRDAMRWAFNFAHLRGVAVHVTVNTIVSDEEREECADYLRFLDEAGADAVLVQDLGVAMLARQVAPDLPLHASTQMTVHSLDGVLELAGLGFTRVVLSRELSLKDIRYICAHSPVEIEVFMHGALCVCYSGQCLMSSLIGGRSGNRGRCAQPCRLPYTLVDEKGQEVLKGKAGEYLLSPKDLKTLELLPEYMAAGVASLKIEGRMKRPEYVAVVVDTYRRALDSILQGQDGYSVDKEAQRRLAQVFNRDFTTAYLEGRPGRNMMSDMRPNNRGILAGRVAKIDSASSRVFMKLAVDVNKGDELDFWVKVGGRTTVTLDDFSDIKGNKITSAMAGDTISFVSNLNMRQNDRAFRVYDAALMTEAKTRFTAGAPVRRIPIAAKARFHFNERPQLEFSLIADDNIYVSSEVDYLIPMAEKRPLTEEAAVKQLKRMGSTVYEIADLKLDIEPGVMVPVSVINDLRRQAAEEMDTLRLDIWKNDRTAGAAQSERNLDKKSANTYDRKGKSSQRQTAQVYVSTASFDGIKAALKGGADGIIFGGDSYHHEPLNIRSYREAAELVKDSGCKLFFNTPRICREDNLPALKAIWQSWLEFNPDGVYVHNIATLRTLREMIEESGREIELRSDYSLISFNGMTLEALEKLGVKQATLSPELNLGGLLPIVKKAPIRTECIVHGRLELMVSEYCVLGSFLGGIGQNGNEACSMPCKSGRYFLKDRKGEQFPVANDQYCHMHLLNGKTLSLLPEIVKLADSGISAVRIEAKAIEPKYIGELVSAYRDYLRRGSELTPEEIAWCKETELNGASDGVTRGHYFRGVL